MTGLSRDPDRFGLGPARLDGATLASEADIAEAGLSFSDRLSRTLSRLPDAGQLAVDWSMAGGGSLLGPGAVAVATEVGASGEVFRAAAEEARLASTLASRAEAIADAYDQRIARLRDVSGVTLLNPQRQQYATEAERRYEAMRRERPAEFDAISWGEGWSRHRQRLQDDIFHERYNDVLSGLAPDVAASLPYGRTIDEEAVDIARRAVERSAAASAAGFEAAPFGAAVATIAGGMVGQGRDPLFWSTLFAGPAAATGKTALARVGDAALKQGAFNGGLSVATQPFTAPWKRELGLDTGPAAMASEAAVAALFGAVPGGAIQAGAELFTARQLAAAARMKAGRPEAGDVAAVAEALRLDVSDMADVVASAERAALDDAAIGPPPGSPDPVAHAQTLRETIAAVEDPIGEPAPLLLPLDPPIRPEVLAVIDEAGPPPAGQLHRIDGKPVTQVALPARDLGTAARDFQYKSDGDAAGVTGRLRDVTRWDPTASGKTMVFEYADGRRVVADGHQRLGLARRLDTADAPISLDAFLFREADGWSVSDVRALAARKNMQEDSGAAIDAARVLRDRPDLLDGALPLSSPKMKTARALASLSDQAWGLVVNGVAPEREAALVGAMVADQRAQAAILADLGRAGLPSEREARMFITEALDAGVSFEQQTELFGASVTARTLLAERVKVLDRAQQQLRADKRLFGAVVARADDLAGAGNMIDRQGSAVRANQAAMVDELVGRLARRTGPLSAELSAAAQAVADGGSVEAAATKFVAAVRARIDAGGLSALLSEPSRLAPPAPVEPGRLAPSETLPDLFGATAPPPVADAAALSPVDLFDAMVEDVAVIARRIDAADLLKGCKP